MLSLGRCKVGSSLGYSTPLSWGGFAAWRGFLSHRFMCEARGGLIGQMLPGLLGEITLESLGSTMTTPFSSMSEHRAKITGPSR